MKYILDYNALHFLALIVNIQSHKPLLHLVEVLVRPVEPVVIEVVVIHVEIRIPKVVVALVDLSMGNVLIAVITITLHYC